MKYMYFLLGAIVSAPLWYFVIRFSLRRTIAHTRRIAAEARQHEYLAELGSLTGGLAHEIKNPLSTIKVNLQLLIEDLDTPIAGDDQRRWLRRLKSVSSEVSRLQDTLEDFLRYAGRMDIHPRRVDLRELISELVEFFSPQAEGHNVRVRSSLGDESMWAMVDVDMIKQAILNLMINAQQAMSDGGELMIKASQAAADGPIVIEIIDTGPGISPEIAEHIFTAYYTTRHGGTGLGLPTAKRIVCAHEGQISVNSTEGKGTRFVIELPRLQ